MNPSIIPRWCACKDVPAVSEEHWHLSITNGDPEVKHHSRLCGMLQLMPRCASARLRLINEVLAASWQRRFPGDFAKHSVAASRPTFCNTTGLSVRTHNRAAYPQTSLSRSPPVRLQRLLRLHGKWPSNPQVFNQPHPCQRTRAPWRRGRKKSGR
jgi:hypothetical protein